MVASCLLQRVRLEFFKVANNNPGNKQQAGDYLKARKLAQWTTMCITLSVVCPSLFTSHQLTEVSDSSPHRA